MLMKTPWIPAELLRPNFKAQRWLEHFDNMVHVIKKFEMFYIEFSAECTVLNLVLVKLGIGHFCRVLGSIILEPSQVFKIMSGPTLK